MIRPVRSYGEFTTNGTGQSGPAVQTAQAKDATDAIISAPREATERKPRLAVTKPGSAGSGRAARGSSSSAATYAPNTQYVTAGWLRVDGRPVGGGLRLRRLWGDQRRGGGAGPPSARPAPAPLRPTPAPPPPVLLRGGARGGNGAGPGELRCGGCPRRVAGGCRTDPGDVGGPYRVHRRHGALAADRPATSVSHGSRSCSARLAAAHDRHARLDHPRALCQGRPGVAEVPSRRAHPARPPTPRLGRH